MTKKKRNVKIILSILGFLLVAIITFLILWLKPSEAESPNIIRLFDLEEFKHEFLNNVYSPTYLEGMKLSNEKWIRLGSGIDSGKDVYWFIPLPINHSPTLQVHTPDKPFLLEDSRGRAVYVNNLQEAAAADGSSWWFGKSSEKINKLDFNEDRIARFEQDFPFEANHLSFEAKSITLTSESGSELNSHLVIKVDGAAVGEFDVPPARQARKYSLKVRTQPGKHRIEFELGNAKAVDGGGYDRALEVGNVSIGVPFAGIFYKQPKGFPRPDAGEPLSVSYHALDETRVGLIRAVRENAGEVASNYQPLESPVTRIRMRRDYNNMETRRSAALVAPAEISAPVSLSDGSVLSFSYGFLGDGHNPFYAGSLSVIVLDAKNKNIIFKKDLLNHAPLRYRWYDALIDLSQLGDRKAILKIVFSENYQVPATCVIGEPVIRRNQNKEEGDSESPNIILVSLDTLRADHLSYMGYDRETSPYLDRIAKECTVFTKAYSQANWTLPSHKSMLTGYYPRLLEYMAQAGLMERLPAAVPTLATYLKQAGYQNVAFTGGHNVSAEFGFSKDFDFYTEKRFFFRKFGENGERIYKDINIDLALDWLKKNCNTGPFFMFLHTYATHSPYTAPLAYDELFETGEKSDLPREIRIMLLKELLSEGHEIEKKDLDHIVATYDRGIRAVDDQVQRLYEVLKELDLLDNTVLIITSDHGEEFLEHGGFGHSPLYDEVLHVPLLVRWPTVFPAGKRIDENVELLDLVPTILDLLHIKQRYPLPGRSLVPLLRRKNESKGERPLFASKWNWVAIRYGGYKYLVNANEEGNVIEEVFDMQKDPLEKKNILNDKFRASERFSELMLKMLYFMAENQPGWNVLIQPKDEKKYIFGLKNFQHEVFRKYTIKLFRGSSFDFLRLTNNKIEVNKMSLITIDGAFDRGFEIKINEVDDQGRVGESLSAISLGLPVRGKYESPISFRKQKPPVSPFSVHRGISRDIFKDYNAVIWYTPFNFSYDVHGSKEMTKRMQAALKNLGYLQ